jgi:hypothetical protein
MADSITVVPPTVPKDLWNEFENQMRNPVISAQKAMEWFNTNAKLLQSMNANVLMTRDRQRLVPRQATAQPILVGRMVMFFYQPDRKSVV